MSTLKKILPGLAALFLVSAATDAEAFCVKNETPVPVHAQALDVSAFEADIDPDAHVCCNGPQCVNPKKGSATVLVVTGYVPVKTSAGQPGWDAECRATVTGDGWVQVTGNKSKVQCKAHPSTPPGMK